MERIPKRLTRIASLGPALLVFACSSSPKEAAAPPSATSSAAEAKASSPKNAQAEAAASKEQETTERDPAAIEALRRMGEFLRAQQEFSVRSEATTDEVLLDGQKLQFASKIELKVKRPDKLKASVESDRKQREMYFDGKTFTLFGKRNGYYAQAPAPGTINELIQVVDDQYDIQLPLVDLFYWGTEDFDEAAILGAIDVGPARVKGVDTEQYAFRKPDVDFQVWIEKGKTPLPRKLVITSKTEPSEPQHSMLLTWDLAPKLADAEFAFSPPAGSHQITLEKQSP